VTGEWPQHEIDHMNGVPSCNGWVNLREATRRVNMQNQRRPCTTNGCGLLGAHKNGKRFSSSINVNGKLMYLGTFDTPKEAHEAYVTAKRKYHEGNTL
jgi:hypothetical protein